MKLLIIYGTDEEQIPKICKFLKEEAEKSHHEVELIEVSENPQNPEDFDAIIVGSHLMKGKYHPSIQEYLQSNTHKLNNTPGILLTVLDTESEIENELKLITDDFLRETGWQPDHVEHLTNMQDLKKPPREIKPFKDRKKWLNSSKAKEYAHWEQVKEILGKLERGIEKANSESCNAPEKSLPDHAG